MACVAFALVCYDRLPSVRWAILFGLSLALAQGVYYFAIFAVLPFALAEVVVLIETRRIRWQAWLAFVFCGLPLIIFWPLLSHMRTYYGSRYWVPTASVASLPKFYGSYLFLGAAYAGALIAVLSAGVIASHFLRRARAKQIDDKLGRRCVDTDFLGITDYCVDRNQDHAGPAC